MGMPANTNKSNGKPINQWKSMKAIEIPIETNTTNGKTMENY